MGLWLDIDFFIYKHDELSQPGYSRARNTVYCTLLTLIAIPALSAIHYLLHSASDAIALLISALPFVVALMMMKYTSLLKLASNIILISLYFILHWLMQHQGGLLSPPGYWIILIPILSILLCGIRTSLYWLTLCILTIISYYFFYPHLNLPITPIEDILLLQSISIICLLIILYFLVCFFEIDKNEKLSKSHDLIEQQNMTMMYIMQDTKERLKIEKNLKYLAFYDHLTELPNRISYDILLKKLISKAKKNHSKIFLLYLDLDNFKDINSTLGHDVGDLFLKKVGMLFKKHISKHGIICRLGGDEFTLILTKTQDMHVATMIANNIMTTLTKPIAVNNYCITSKASIGIAIYPDHASNSVALTKCADIAMYHAKNDGKGTFRFYNEELSQLRHKQLTMEHFLQEALKNNEFHIDYQPQYAAQNTSIISIEALIRWNNPALGSINPEVFIPVAEKIGMITLIGEWVLKEACKQFKIWQHTGIVSDTTKIAINLSIIQMEQADFLENISDILKEANINPRHVEVELTESIIIKSSDMMLRLLRNLEQLGVSIAMDDFGTGYSSFNRLKTYPLNILKMDKSFLFNMGENNQSIIYSIISLAHSLGLKVVAEGVETEEQYQFLRDSGCDYLQGFYLCPPCDAPTMTEYLTSLKK